MIKISPSILASDFAHLADDVARVERAGAEYLHLDVMDGHFVPNLSFGACVVSALRKHSRLVFDTHLMISDPLRYLPDFAKAGSDIVTFHYEAVENAADVIDKIHALGMRASVSIKPATAADVVFPLLGSADMVLVMTVEPGFGGQSLIPSTLEKVRQIRKECLRRGLDTDIEVDGGISAANIGLVTENGANVVVAGSAVFGAPDPADAIKAMREAADAHMFVDSESK